MKLTWFGGEPLLNTEAISYISDAVIEFCDRLGVTYSAAVITNGSLINEKTIIDLVGKRVTFVQITLDGDEETSRRYKRCTAENYHNSLNGIVIAANRIRVNVRFNTDGENIESIISTVKMLKSMMSATNAEKNVRYYLACIDRPSENMMPTWYVKAHCRFLNFLTNEKMREDILVALPKARFSSCGACTNSMNYIAADGNIVKCEHYLGSRNHDIGSVEDGLFHNSEEARFRDIAVAAKCEKCSFLPICRQGCLKKRLDENCQMNCDEFKENVGNVLHSLAIVSKK